VTDEISKCSDVSWDQIDARVDRLLARFDLLIAQVKRIGENITTDYRALGEKLDRSFEETRAMMKFSFDDINRRVGALEDARLREGEPLQPSNPVT
jgi:hypothetical protein